MFSEPPRFHQMPKLKKFPVLSNHKVYKQPKSKPHPLSCCKVTFTTLVMTSNSINIYLTPQGHYIYTDDNEKPQIDGSARFCDHPIPLPEVIDIFERLETILHHDFKDKFSKIKDHFDQLNLIEYPEEFDQLSPEMVLTAKSFVDQQINALAQICELDENIEPVFRQALEIVTKSYFNRHLLNNYI
jgi:DNA-directed RNA polymerase subunit F